MIKIAPSLLAGDFANMGSSVRVAENAGADMIHCDVMDGIFVPNITFGFQMIEAVHRVSSLPLDVHLMIDRPERYVERFAEAGADIVTFHVEATNHLQRTLQLIHDCNCRAGVVLNPATPTEFIRYVLDDVDMILLMSVNPGYGGQRFLLSTLAKVTEVRRMIQALDRQIELEVDGGVSSLNAAKIVRAGADVLVVGSAFFGAADPNAELKALRKAATGADDT